MDTFSVLNSLAYWRIPVLVLVAFSFAFILDWLVKKYLMATVIRYTRFFKLEVDTLEKVISLLIYFIAFLLVIIKILAHR